MATNHDTDMSKGLHAKPTELRLADKDGKPSSSAPKEIQLIKAGTFFSDWYGEFRLTSQDLQKMVANFNDNVRGVDCAIDYDHMNMRCAAAWITKLSIRNDSELWAEVEWTEDGAKLVTSRQYRYTSAEFDYAYKDNETQQDHGLTLLGAALTNRPFVKRMEPVVAHEKEKVMTPEQIKKLQDDLAAEQAKTAKLEADKKASDEKVAASELKLAEQTKTAEQLKADAVKAEKTAKFDEMLGKGIACEAQREAYLAGDLVKFTELAQPVKLAETNPNPGAPVKTEVEVKSGDEAITKVIELSQKRFNDMNKSIPYDKVVGMVLSENKELREKYEAATKVN